MIIGIYSICDSVANVFDNPFYATTDGVALRKFGNTMELPENKNKYVKPQDLKLFRLGTFDNESGRIAAADEVVELANAANVEKIVLGSDVQTEAQPMTEKQFNEEKAKEVE